MKESTPATGVSTKFTRYAAASAAAFGAATVAQAQFTGDYSLTSPSPVAGNYPNVGSSGTFGAWTVSAGGPGAIRVDTTSADTFLILSAGTGSNNTTPTTFDFMATATTDINVSFSAGPALATSGAAFYYDGASFLSLGSSYSVVSSFLVTQGSTFGFRITTAYVGGAGVLFTSLGISAFNAVTAVPEPGTTGLLAGCAALGFIALTGTREIRRRTAAKNAA